MLHSHLFLQWVTHKKNLFAITCIATAQAFFSPVEGKVTGKEALTLRRIVEFWKDGDYEIAKRQIHAFLDQFPKSPAKDHLFHMLGDLYFHEKNYQEAYSAYSQISTDELLDQTLFCQLYSLAELKDYPALVHLSDRYFKKDRDKEEALEAHYLVADALVRVALSETGEKQKYYADQAFLHYQALESSKYQNHFLFAFAELQKIFKNYPLAIATYFELAQQYPDKKEDLLFQAATLQVFLDKTAAINTFSNVASLEGKTARAARFNTISLLMEMGKHEELVSACQNEPLAYPDHKFETIQLYRGLSHLALGQFNEAKKPLLDYVEEGKTSPTYLKKAVVSLIRCAQATTDLPLLNLCVQKLKESSPNDPDLAKALLLRSQMSIDAHEIQQAYSDLQEILEHFPTISNRETILYTSGVLLAQDGKWNESRTLFLSFLSEYPESSYTPLTYRHLTNCAFKLSDKEQALSYIYLLRENYPNALSQQEVQDLQLLHAKVLYETERYAEALSLVEPYIPTFTECSNLYEVHLLCANCHEQLSSPPDAFILHAEKVLSLRPEIADKNTLHLRLFNAYLQLKDKNLQAAEHLASVLADGKIAIKWENQLWLTDFYISHAKKDRAALPKADELIKLALEKQSDLLSLEPLLLKYSEVLTLNHRYEDKIALLQKLTAEQEKDEGAWKYKRLAKLELAKGFEKCGNPQNALKIYEQLIDSSTHFASFTGSSALLHRSRLQLSTLKAEQIKENDPSFSEILDDLKELQIRKNIQSEPIHLEAALDYAHLRVSLLPLSEQNERYLFFLNRIKEDFTAEDDLISKEYTSSRIQSEEKNLLFKNYMTYIDAEMMRTNGDVDASKKAIQMLLSQPDLHPYLKERIQARGATYE